MAAHKSKAIICSYCDTSFTAYSDRRHCSIKCRFMAVADAFVPTEGCWEWPLPKLKNGYAQIRQVGERLYVHRISYIQFVGEVPAGSFICHRCDNPSCFNPAHLFLGTPADNVADMIAKGRQAYPKGTEPPHLATAEMKRKRLAGLKAWNAQRTAANIARQSSPLAAPSASTLRATK